MTWNRPSIEDRLIQRAAERRKTNLALMNGTLKPLRQGTMGRARITPAPKRAPIRSAKLLAAVRTLPCMVTGRTEGVQPAHSNWSQHGKGRSQKADDNRVAALHHTLHAEIDQGHLLNAEERQELWWNAHCATVRELQRRGLWPAGVPVPQLEDFWKP